MVDSSMAIPAIPADLRGKEMAIPAGYLHESKETAGKAGIETNPSMCGRNNYVCHMRLHALEVESVWFLSPLSPQSPCFQAFNLRG